MDEEKSALISSAQIAVRVKELAQEITGDGLSKLTVVSLLRGSFVFTADLIRALANLGCQLEVEFLGFSSYGSGTQSSGALDEYGELRTDVKRKTVLIIDDILETGHTLAAAQMKLEQAGAALVKTCVLLQKRIKQKVDVQPDYIGFKIEDTFVVGYGLDHANRFRELPYIKNIEL